MAFGNSYEAKLMEYFTSFELKDLIGFARIVKVDLELIKKAVYSAAIAGENAVYGEDWENLIVSTVENFSKMGRKERRELLKQAKEIKLENEKNRVKEQNASPSE